MKIAVLTTSYPKWPGETTAPFIEELAAGVAARGHEVHVLMPYRADLRRAKVERGVYLHTYHYALHPKLEVWGYAGAMHGDVGVKNVAFLAAPFALLAGLQALLRLTATGGYGMIHAHWALPNGPVAALCARARKLPLVLSLHGSDVFLAEQSAPAAWAARWAARQADALTACSGDLAARMAALGGRPERMMVVPYGVDPQAFSPVVGGAAAVRARLHIGPRQPVIFTLGRMVFKKGFGVLLDAMPRVLQDHPEAVLVLGGDGDLCGALRQQAQRLGIAGHVRFPGIIPRNDVPAFFAMADVATFPSVHDQRGNVDGLPNVLLEAMSIGRPIVASHIGGIPEVITDGVHGLLTPEGDPVALAAAISRLLHDRQLAAGLAAGARERVEQELRWSHIAARIEDVYIRAQARHNEMREQALLS
ncbi:MAG: glycosyltransferase family 4 protein [Chloroflexota bacterium]|nr:glycosyltransferase family 4 protein [Chloroflexota bacterium]